MPATATGPCADLKELYSGCMQELQVTQHSHTALKAVPAAEQRFLAPYFANYCDAIVAVVKYAQTGSGSTIRQS
jgi:hypothetical protein